MRNRHFLSLVTCAALTVASIAHAQVGTVGTGTGLPPETDNGASSTLAAPALGVTPNQALTAIQAQGFTNVRNLKRVGNTYTATATQNGEAKQVQVDANTGALIQQ